MTRPLEGVRILEVEQAAFVPSAGLALVDYLWEIFNRGKRRASASTSGIRPVAR